MCRFTQSLQLFGFFSQFDVFLETGFALREGLDLFGFDLALEARGAEFRVSAAEAGDRFADLAIECPIGRIDDPRRLRNRRGPIVHKAIQTVALPAYIGRSLPETIGRTWPEPNAAPKSGNRC